MTTNHGDISKIAASDNAHAGLAQSDKLLANVVTEASQIQAALAAMNAKNVAGTEAFVPKYELALATEQPAPPIRPGGGSKPGSDYPPGQYPKPWGRIPLKDLGT
jgi:hypothetical protein